MKLLDFGLSRVLETDHSLAESFVGTFNYMAPERMTGNPYSFLSDTWAFKNAPSPCRHRLHFLRISSALLPKRAKDPKSRLGAADFFATGSKFLLPTTLLESSMILHSLQKAFTLQSRLQGTKIPLDPLLEASIHLNPLQGIVPSVYRSRSSTKLIRQRLEAFSPNHNLFPAMQNLLSLLHLQRKRCCPMLQTLAQSP